MAIPEGAGANFNFFRNNVEKYTSTPESHIVRAAQSLTKPEQMSLISRIIDWFLGGDKANDLAAQTAKVANKVEELVFNICIADPDAPFIKDGHETVLSSFVELRDMAKRNTRDQFSFDYQTVKGRDENGRETTSIRYEVNIAGTTLMSSTIDGADRDGILAFHKAMVDTGLLSSDVSSPPVSVEHADAKLMKALEDTLPARGLADPGPDMAVVAAKMDAINRDPGYVDASHAAIGEKVRILSEAFPEQEFSIDFPNDRHTYEITVRSAEGKASPALQRAVVGSDASEQAQFPALLSSAIKQSVANQMKEFGANLADEASFITGNAETMCDGLADRAKLMSEMTNADYSSATFTGVMPNPGNATFTAMFGDKSMVFSNRMSSVELRGAALQERLKAPFANLKEILSESHGTAQDRMLRYVLNTTKQNYLGRVDMDSHEHAAVYREISDVVVGKTTLGDIWKLTPTPLPSASDDAMPDDFLPPPPPAPSPRAANVSVIRDNYFDPNLLA